MHDDSAPRGPATGSASPPSSFATLARRISAWTSRLLVSALILVGGIVFGRHLVRLWQTDEMPPIPAMAPGPGVLNEPVDLRFGSSAGQIRRQAIEGDEATARKSLRKLCRETVATAQGPVGPTGRHEQELLDMLATNEPVEQQPGQWRLYELNQALPMTVAVRLIPSDPRMVAQPGVRVVIWGIAAPLAEGRWVAYAFSVVSDTRQSAGASFEVSLPPGGTRVLHVTSLRGEQILTFTGSAASHDWRDFYDHWFASRAWRARQSWREQLGGWSARYESTDQPAASVDLRLSTAPGGKLLGVAIVNPPMNPSAEKQP